MGSKAAALIAGQRPKNNPIPAENASAMKMDWRDILRTQLESSLKNDFTFMRPSKRSGEVLFPGMNKDEELNIAVALDTSGSIGKDMLRDFLSEVQGIMEEYQDYLPGYRGHHEQNMALTGIGYARAMRRKQIFVATSSVLRWP